MSVTTSQASAEAERQRQWQRGLIRDLGDDLRQCIELMHHESPNALPCLLRAAERLGCPLAVSVGISLYWRCITLWKEGKPSKVWP